jgi:hypothetical protein
VGRGRKGGQRRRHERHVHRLSSLTATPPVQLSIHAGLGLVVVLVYIKGEGVVGAMERSNSSWFGWWRKKAREGQGVGRPRDREKVVVDGSEIRHGMLSVSELRPAVEDIGAALGLPAEGASPNTDQIYSEVCICVFTGIMLAACWFCLSGVVSCYSYVLYFQDKGATMVADEVR